MGNSFGGSGVLKENPADGTGLSTSLAALNKIAVVGAGEFFFSSCFPPNKNAVVGTMVATFASGSDESSSIDGLAKTG